MIYTNLLSHPKTGRLVDTLGLNSSSVEPETIAAGMLVSLWTWAAQNAYHGDLSACSDRVIAKACMWKKEPQKLVKALQECGWMDGKVLHDWDEYAELYINQIDNTREKTKERVRNYRERKKAAASNLKCSYCGSTATGFDHVVPLIKGGTADESNLVPCCQWCNSAKQDRDLADFLNRNRDRVKDDLVLSNAKLTKLVTLNDSNRYVTVTCNESNAPTLHNHTEHNNISLLSKERKERKKESPSVTFPPDEELPHVRMLIRCGEQYTQEDVEAGRRIWLAQQRGENA